MMDFIFDPNGGSGVSREWGFRLATIRLVKSWLEVSLPQLRDEGEAQMDEDEGETEKGHWRLPRGIGTDPNGGSGLTREMELLVTIERIKEDWLRELREKVFGRAD
jgi:hypothetical protein